MRGSLGRDYRAHTWPIGLRDCYDVARSGLASVSCADEHDLQAVGVTFFALGLVDSEILRADVARPREPVSARLTRLADRLCEGPLDAALGTGWDRRHLQAWSEPAGEWTEIEDVAFTCLVTTSTEDTVLPGGDLIGGGAADHVRPVPYASDPGTA